MSTPELMRAASREIFLHALAQCSVEKAFARHINCDRGILRICEDLYDLKSFARVLVVSFGKAGHRMAEALADQAGSTVGGIISDPNPQPVQLPGYRYFSGSHPWPNQESLRAAEAALKSLGALPPDSLVIFMISGGGSSAMEKPLDEEISLDDAVETCKVLVRSSAPIAQLNAIRKHLSAVKGGRLAVAARHARQVSILISDVPAKSLDSLASGPTMPDTSTTEDCYRIVREHNLLPELPRSVQELMERRALEETPKKDNPAFARSRWWTVLSSETAEKAAAEAAAAHGFAVEIDHSCDDWEFSRAADYLLDRVRRLRQGVSRACVISGGEVTLKVPTGSGTGGRNQHFALYCAQRIGGENIAVLSGGTDGIDGNSSAAGGVVDGTTMERARAAGADPQRHFAEFNSHPFFDRLADSIHTGPTGTNVRDLRILLAW